MGKLFDALVDVTVDNLKLRPIGSHEYLTAKALATYLSLLIKNQYSLKNTLDFARQLDRHTLEDDETLVSYDVSRVAVHCHTP